MLVGWVREGTRTPRAFSQLEQCVYAQLKPGVALRSER